MKNQKNSLKPNKAKLLFILSLLIIGFSCQKSWDYSNQKKWAKLYPDCGSQMQSPVNIENPQRLSYLKPLFIDYQPTDTFEIKYNGKILKIKDITGEIVVPDTSNILGHTFYLAEILIHTPSEHTINGKQFPAEIQFINIDTAANFMVLSVLVTEGEENPELNKIINALENKKFQKTIPQYFDPNNLIPFSVNYYYYVGSLTIPPCTPNVQWFIMKEPIEASKEQLQKLQSLLGKNNRDIQPLNNRLVAEF